MSAVKKHIIKQWNNGEMLILLDVSQEGQLATAMSFGQSVSNAKLFDTKIEARKIIEAIGSSQSLYEIAEVYTIR
jgi:hypothetical protein